jgi:hypothetical protein
MDENSPFYRLYICTLAGVALTAFVMLSIVGFNFITRFNTAITYVIWAVFIIVTLMLLLWLGFFLLLDIRKRNVKIQILSSHVKVIDIVNDPENSKLRQQQTYSNHDIVEIGENLIAIAGSGFTWAEFAELVYGYSNGNTTRKLKEIMLEAHYDVSRRPPCILQHKNTQNLTNIFEKRYANKV